MFTRIDDGAEPRSDSTESFSCGRRHRRGDAGGITAEPHTVRRLDADQAAGRDVGAALFLVRTSSCCVSPDTSFVTQLIKVVVCLFLRPISLLHRFSRENDVDR